MSTASAPVTSPLESNAAQIAIVSVPGVAIVIAAVILHNVDMRFGMVTGLGALLCGLICVNLAALYNKLVDRRYTPVVSLMIKLTFSFMTAGGVIVLTYAALLMTGVLTTVR